MQRFVFCLFSLIALTVNAQNINVRGVVTDTRNGKVIPNAIVTLLQPGLMDTTVATGIYVITKGNVAVLPVLNTQRGKISLNQGVLKLELTTSAQVKVEIFNVKGDLLKKEVLQTAVAGIHQFNIAESYRATNLLVLKVSIGNQMMTFRCLPEHNNNFAVNASFDNAMSLTSSSGLHKATAAINDTLHIQVNGYLAKYVPISSYDTTVNVNLDSILPGPSLGCGKTLGNLNKSGTYTVKSSNVNRTYIIDIPTNYDKNKPYRLIFGMHCMGGSAARVAATDNGDDLSAFYSLKTQADKDNIQCIYVAPQGNGDGTWQGEPDRIFFSDLQKLIKDTLCIDTARVFCAGFSFGAMFTYALSLEFPKVFRAVACYAPANWNMDQPTNNHIPLAYFQTTGTDDGLCKWINNDAKQEGGKYCVLQHAQDNKCIIPATIPLTTTGKHVSTEFQGGLRPVKFGSFQGGHQCMASDPGSSVNWIEVETWEFFKRF